MQRRRAAVGDQGAGTGVLAPLDRVGAGCGGHVLVNDLANARRCGQGVELKRGGHIAIDGAPAGVGVEPYGAAREELGPQAAKQGVGIRHRGQHPAPPVGGRPRFGTGAGRTYGDAAEVIDGGDGAAAGANFHHFDHRNAHR